MHSPVLIYGKLEGQVFASLCPFLIRRPLYGANNFLKSRRFERRYRDKLLGT